MTCGFEYICVSSKYRSLKSRVQKNTYIIIYVASQNFNVFVKGVIEL